MTAALVPAIATSPATGGAILTTELGPEAQLQPSSPITALAFVTKRFELTGPFPPLARFSGSQRPGGWFVWPRGRQQFSRSGAAGDWAACAAIGSPPSVCNGSPFAAACLMLPSSVAGPLGWLAGLRGRLGGMW